MLMFSRQARLDGSPSAMGWAVEVTAKANEHAENPISLWAGSFGLPNGAIAWSTQMEDLGAAGRFNEKMMGDADAVALVERGAAHVQEIMPDTLAVPIHGEIAGPAPAGSYAGVVSAVAMPGQMEAAGEWAVAAAGTYTEVTGLPAVVAVVVAGPIGQFNWYVMHEDVASVQQSLMATAGSDTYRKLLSSAGGLFHPGASQMFAQKVA